MIPANASSALADHLWQSTLFAAAAGLLAIALRNNHARARYWIWWTASLKFLVPFSLLVAMGSHFGWSTAPADTSSGLFVAMEQISRPFSAPAVALRTSTATVQAAESPIPMVLFAIWACGFAAAVFFWWVRWRRVHAAMRAGSPLALDAEVPVVSAPGLLEPGIFGVVRPVLLLPDGITDHLAPAHLKAILAHELCHVRRRDNLTAAIHMAVEAIFWFHPLIWWLGVRLIEERERACDEEVLRLGNEPGVYAESILKTCQYYLESPLVCISGVTGSDLKKRVVRIMTQRAAHGLDFGRKLLLGAAGLAALAGPIVFGLMNAPPSRAQSQP
ncbi:MAG: M56 family metallopeptidase, partial [Bryobacteraceae bacterium]